MIALLLALGCGEPAPHAVVSAPVPATVDLSEGEDEEPVFVDLEGLFVKGPVQLPAAMLDVRWGAKPALVKVANRGLADPDRPIMNTTVAERLVIGGTPLGYPDVRHSFIFDGETLARIDLSLPAKAAMPVLEEAWGPAATVGVDGEGRPTATWAGETLDVVLLEVDDRAIVSFTPREEG